MKIHFLLALVLSIGFSLGGLSAATKVPPEPVDLTLTTLGKYERQWLAKGFKAYDFKLERSCFCAPRSLNAEFEVRGSISRMTNSSDQMAKSSFQDYVSVGKLFVRMRELLRNGGRVAAVFDAKRGYPSQIVLDRVPQATDDELYLTISSFMVR
jgi:hypothetical protein